MNPKSLISIIFKNGTSVELGTAWTEAALNAVINSEPNGPGKKRWMLPLIGGKERKTKEGNVARTTDESYYFDVADIHSYSIETIEIVTKLSL